MERLKLRHVRCLVAVAEHKSLVKAAAALHLSQPAISKTLAELEAALGQRLFERTPRGVGLTAPGRDLLRYASRSLCALREGFDRVTSSRYTHASALVLGALPNVATTVLPAVLPAFTERYPLVQLHVRTGTNRYLIDLMQRGEVDAVMGRLATPSEMQGLSFEQLYLEELRFVVRPAHPLLAQPSMAPEHLAQHYLVLPEIGTRIREAADLFFMATGLGPPSKVIESDDPAFGRSFAMQTDAIWCVPQGAVENDLRSGMLIALDLDTSTTSGPVGVTLRVDRPPSEGLQWLLQAIRSTVKGD